MPLRRDLTSLIGAIDSLRLLNEQTFRIQGWIGNRKAWVRPQAYMVVFRDLSQQGTDFTLRPDLEKVHRCLRFGGFSVDVPIGDRVFDRSQVRMFVVFDRTTFAELEIKEGVIQ